MSLYYDRPPPALISASRWRSFPAHPGCAGASIDYFFLSVDRSASPVTLSFARDSIGSFLSS